MSAVAEEQIPCPPTFRFRPTKRELVEFYLLPLARGQDPFPGIIIERYGLGGEDEAYFIVRASDGKRPRARQDRGCDGGVGVWKMQRSLEKNLRIRGERITCHVSNLNLHIGKGKKSGSVGWVMHEYTIAAPPCPSSVKICHIAFTGHGRMRQRVPACQETCQGGRACVDATAAGGPALLTCSWAMVDHSSGVAYVSADEEISHVALTDDGTFLQSPLLASSDLPTAASGNAEQYAVLEEQLPATEQQDIMVPQLMIQQQATMGGQLSASELEFWTSIGVDVESNNSAEQEQLVQSDRVVPNMGTMAGDDIDFWSSLLADIQTNLAVPDLGNMANGKLGGADFGGCSLICN